MKKIFVGIDVSKLTLDVAVLNQGIANILLEKVVKNNVEGFTIMLKYLAKQGYPPTDCWFVYEHTGVYNLQLSCFLQDKNLCYSVVPALQIKRSLGITRGKNDKVDARRIATYAQIFQQKLKPTVIASKTLLSVRELLTYRLQITKQTTQLKNSVKAHEQMAKVTSESWIGEDIHDTLRYLSNKLKLVDGKLNDLISNDEGLNRNYDLVLSIKGIGPIIAAFMLVYTSNFSSFETGREFACYSGIAPFENTSGTSIRGKTKVSSLGNKIIKTLIYNGANSAVRYDPELHQYYERKKAEGKAHSLVINAVACKLVNRCFAVTKRGTPYVSLYENNFKKNLVIS